MENKKYTTKTINAIDRMFQEWLLGKSDVMTILNDFMKQEIEDKLKLEKEKDLIAADEYVKKNKKPYRLI